MVAPGPLRARLARILRSAYADGLMSESTFSYRLDLLLSEPVVDPGRLVGDLSRRSSRRLLATRAAALGRRLGAWVSGRSGPGPELLALDWDGTSETLLVGRDPGCDVVLSDATVSRQHARLNCREGRWILCDLQSKNGTTVNRARVGRCELRPGDRVVIGGHELLVD